MKKNVMMRVASALLVAVLMTTCAISGTFAKYTTTKSSSDSARVANWGFEPVDMNLSDLFLGSYTNVVSNNGDDVIAPGTTGDTSFSFAYDETNGVNGPEVAYTFTVKVEATCDPAIVANTNIKWKLDSGDWGTWDQLIAAITLLSGDSSGTKQYAPNTLPAAFGKDDNTHTIEWKWDYSTTDEADILDTAMGNDNVLSNCSIKITITATQVD